MYLTKYDFTGDPTDLVARHDRMLEIFPAEILDLHVVTTRPDGMTVLDGCPDEATARSFAVGAEFTAAIAQVGLPAPTVTYLGDVASVIAKPALIG